MKANMKAVKDPGLKAIMKLIINYPMKSICRLISKLPAKEQDYTAEAFKGAHTALHAPAVPLVAAQTANTPPAAVVVGTAAVARAHAHFKTKTAPPGWKWVTVDSGANEIVDTQLTVDDPLALMKLVGHSVGMGTYSRGQGHMHAQFMMEDGAASEPYRVEGHQMDKSELIEPLWSMVILNNIVGGDTLVTRESGECRILLDNGRKILMEHEATGCTRILVKVLPEASCATYGVYR
jgi:hypothetical protein